MTISPPARPFISLAVFVESFVASTMKLNKQRDNYLRKVFCRVFVVIGEPQQCHPHIQFKDIPIADGRGIRFLCVNRWMG